MAIALLFFSIIAVFAISGGPMMMGPHRPMESGRFINTRQWIEPPARKSVMVDPDGDAHRTADNTQMTKRDRARYSRQDVPAPPAQAMAPEPVIVEAAPVEIKPAPVEAYVFKSDIAEPSMNQKIEEELMKDPTLSESAQYTLKVRYREGLVILQGVVSDEAEKERLRAKAAKISGVSSVENQLHTIGDYSA